MNCIRFLLRHESQKWSIQSKSLYFFPAYWQRESG